jgi:hypothetical protein
MGNVHNPMLSPSSARLWVNCAKAFQFVKTYPTKDRNEAPSKAAKEGEEAHKIAEKILKWALTKRKEGKLDWNDGEICKDNPMHRYGMRYAKMVIRKLEEIENNCVNPVCEVERVLDCSKYACNCIGSPDIFVFGGEKLVVIDYKYGHKIVEAKNNYQLMIYALGVLSTYEPFTSEVKSIELIIYQPRELGWTDSFCLLKEALLEWGETILRPASQAVMEPHPQAHAGDWCEHCNYKRFCYDHYKSICEYKPEYERIISTREVARMRTCVKEAKKIKNNIDTEKKDSFPVIRDMHKSLDLAKVLADQIMKDDYERKYIESKNTVALDKYNNKDIRTTDLFLVTYDSKRAIKTTCDVRMIFEKAFTDSLGEPLILADQDNNACILLSTKNISKYIEYKMYGIDGFIPNELTVKFHGEEYLMIKKDVYNTFREHIVRIHDYLDDADTIFEYCKSIIENIAQN